MGVKGYMKSRVSFSFNYWVEEGAEQGFHDFRKRSTGEKEYVCDYLQHTLELFTAWVGATLDLCGELLSAAS